MKHLATMEGAPSEALLQTCEAFMERILTDREAREAHKDHDDDEDGESGGLAVMKRGDSRQESQNKLVTGRSHHNQSKAKSPQPVKSHA